jgi:hypothetical protein
MTRRKSARRTKKNPKARRERTTNLQPHQITIVDDVGTAQPPGTTLKDGGQVVFYNAGRLTAHTTFRGLFEQAESNVRPQTERAA